MGLYKQFAWASLNCIRKLNQNKNHFLVAAMMKAGGTYLSTVLSLLPNRRKVSLVPFYGRREQELSVIKLIRNMFGSSYVAHHHLRYSDTTDLLIKSFDLKPVVLA